MPVTNDKKIRGFSVRNAIKSFFIVSSEDLADEALDQHNGKLDNPKSQNPKQKTSE